MTVVLVALGVEVVVLLLLLLAAAVVVVLLCIIWFLSPGAEVSIIC